MASLLRQIVAGPRVKHAETGLDLCYVTENIIATSGPSQTYPQRAYRNPLDQLVAYLDARHGDGWAIWEFRAEGTGYPDEAVHGRIRHYPFPDHHPPPFRLVPGIVGGMRKWLEGGSLWEGEDEVRKTEKNGNEESGGGEGKGSGKEEKKDRVVVVHCKAGKGRSGTMACSYLIAECGWGAEDAMARFTERRMRPGFGAGVSIPSQRRWIGYVERWARAGKPAYVDRPVEVLEVHVWGLRNGVKVSVEGFVEEGRRIEVFHTFGKEERIVVEAGAPGGGGVLDMVQDMVGYGGKSTTTEEGTGESESDAPRSDELNHHQAKKSATSKASSLIRKLSKREAGSAPNLIKLAGNSKNNSSTSSQTSSTTTITTTTASLASKSSPRSQSATTLAASNSSSSSNSDPEPGGQAVIFKPAAPIRLPTSDINIAAERRSRAPGKKLGLALVTAVAHVWFNAYFEGNGPEQNGRADESGVFEIAWDKMDGIKGTEQRGARALDRMAVVWRFVEDEKEQGEEIREPGKEGPVPQATAADWRGGNRADPDAGEELGLVVVDGDDDDEGLRMKEGGKGKGVCKVMVEKKKGEGDGDSMEGVKVSGPDGEEDLGDVEEERKQGRRDTEKKPAA
ncbi:hypothetical protein VTJ04DRAFT_5090 [Mycothermus thermophilus]|uniref:uncharacterized protein n=1 Tax=Humicola insolens TaxID=85995 RepID=UPI0037432C17